MIDINKLFDTKQLFDNRYLLLRKLSGSGGSGDVWLGLDTRISTDISEMRAMVAIKIYRPKNMIDVEGEYQFRNEFKKVFNCHHQNIITPTYFSIWDETPYLVLPYCPSGSSEKLIGNISHEELKRYIGQVASGLAYLHGHNPQIIHQDIKPANVLIDDNSNYVITDFGISTQLGVVDNDDDEVGGTFAYMAPERFLEDQVPIPQSDIWALGATLYELVTGDTPFGNDGGAIQHPDTIIPPIKQQIPDKIKQLIYSCLAFDPSERPSADVIARYEDKHRSIKAIIGGSIIAVIIVGVVIMLTASHSKNPDEQFNTLCSRGDSILTTQCGLLLQNDGVPTHDTNTELEKSLVFYRDAIVASVSDTLRRDTVRLRMSDVESLMDAIRSYDRAVDLASKALRTELDQVYVEQTLIKQQQIKTIKQIISHIP